MSLVWVREPNGYSLYCDKDLRGVVYRVRQTTWAWTPLRGKHPGIEAGCKSAKRALWAHCVAEILEG